MKIKKQKAQKIVSWKRSRSNSTWKKVKTSRKNEKEVYSLKKDHMGLLKKNTLTLKIKQRFKSERKGMFFLKKLIRLL